MVRPKATPQDDGPPEGDATDDREIAAEPVAGIDSAA
jgi:hypothetical protein